MVRPSFALQMSNLSHQRTLLSFQKITKQCPHNKNKSFVQECQTATQLALNVNAQPLGYDHYQIYQDN